MRGNLNSRSAYDLASPASRGSWGSPAPTSVIGSCRCTVRCRPRSAPRTRRRAGTAPRRSGTRRPSRAPARPRRAPPAGRSGRRSRLPVSAMPSTASTSIPAVTEPSVETVSEKDLRIPAARRSLSVQVAFGARLEERAAHEAAHPGAELLVPADLRGDRHPAAVQGAALERAEQHRLADAAQTCDQHRLLRIAAAEPLEQDLEPSSSASRPTSAGGGAPAFGVYGLARGFTA